MLSGARIGAAGLGALTAFLLARTLSKADYGALALLTALTGALVVLVDAGLTASVARYLSEGRVGRGLFVRVMALRSSFACMAALAILGYAATGAAAEYGSATMLAAVLLLANSTVSVAHGVLPTLRRVRAAAVLTVLQPAIELCGILLATRIGLNAPGALAAMAIAAGISAAIGLVAMLAHSMPANDPVAVADVWRYALPLFAVTACVAVFGVIDQLLINVFHDSATLAPYALGWKLVMFLHVPALAIAIVIAPRLAQDVEQAPELFAIWVRRTVVLNAGVLAVVAALAPEVMSFISDQYRNDGPVLRALICYAFALGLAPLVSMACNFLGAARERLRVAAVAVGVNIALDVILIPGWGVYGAALSSTVGYLIYVYGHARLVEQMLGAKFWSAGPLLIVRIGMGVVTAIVVCRVGVHGLSSLGPWASVGSAAAGLGAYFLVTGIGALR